MAAKRKVLIDTDIGDNMDDAFAIFAAMALNFEIVGITTVFRDTVGRAKVAKKLLTLFGKGYEAVPVYAGFSGDFNDNTDYLCSFDEDFSFTPENTNPEYAVDFIIDCCHRYGKDLTVIALGPFTNIAKVIEKDPAALNCVEKVMIMGGAYFKQYADWNVMCDVPAAALMFQKLTNLVCIGADVTHRLADDGYLEKALDTHAYAGGALDYVRQLYRRWRQDYPKEPLVLHDALVIYCLHDPALCQTRSIPVTVITEGFAKGLTLNVADYSKSHLNSAYQNTDPVNIVEAAWDVDVSKFHQFIHTDVIGVS